MQSETQKLPWFASVMYHRVVDEIDGSDPYHLSITSDQLDAQLAYLKSKGYESVNPITAITDAMNAPERNRKQVVLTFDDGYMDFMTHAVPVLQKHGYAAMLMVVTDRIGGRNEWDEGRAEQVPLMGVSELREAHSSGIWIGSHSKTHPAMATLDAAVAKAEIVESKAKLEDLLGEPVPIFCFPYGSSSPAVQSTVQEAGFLAAYGIEQRDHQQFRMTRVDGVKANGAGLKWRFRITGGHYRFRTNASKAKSVVRNLKR